MGHQREQELAKALIAFVDAVRDPHSGMQCLLAEHHPLVSQARKALALVESANKTTDDYVLVPREPTKEYMAEATNYAARVIKTAEDTARDFWDMVIAYASPSHDKPGAGWMPIESAPKDGSVILLLHSNAALCCYSSSVRPRKKVAIGYFDRWWITGVPGGHGEGGGDNQYTHWCPMPDYPPSPSTAQGGGDC